MFVSIVQDYFINIFELKTCRKYYEHNLVFRKNYLQLQNKLGNKLPM